MLQYDFTQTALIDCVSREELPTEAEMFVLTAALLLVREATYSGLAKREMAVSDEDVSAIAECIEYRLSAFARDFGDADRLRDRLRRFVGLRIGAVLPYAKAGSAEPK